MSVGKKLRELRGSRTQDEISKELGITKSSYAMYERDERVPRDEVKVRWFGAVMPPPPWNCRTFILPLIRC